MTLIEFMKYHVRMTSASHAVILSLTLKPGKKQKPIYISMRGISCSPDVLLTMSQLLY